MSSFTLAISRAALGQATDVGTGAELMRIRQLINSLGNSRTGPPDAGRIRRRRLSHRKAPESQSAAMSIRRDVRGAVPPFESRFVRSEIPPEKPWENFCITPFANPNKRWFLSDVLFMVSRVRSDLNMSELQQGDAGRFGSGVGIGISAVPGRGVVPGKGEVPGSGDASDGKGLCPGQGPPGCAGPGMVPSVDP